MRRFRIPTSGPLLIIHRELMFTDRREPHTDVEHWISTMTDQQIDNIIFRLRARSVPS